MGNFSGWLQRTESSAVNNALSHLVTERRVKNKDVLNSFSSLLGNCHLMGHSEHKKSHFLPSLFHWGSGKFLSHPKISSEHVPLTSVAIWLRASFLSGFIRWRQTFSSACAAAELRVCWVVAPLQESQLEPSLSWAVLGHFGVKALLEVRGCVAI